jgi:hypothetical protein
MARQEFITEDRYRLGRSVFARSIFFCKFKKRLRKAARTKGICTVQLVQRVRRCSGHQAIVRSEEALSSNGLGASRLMTGVVCVEFLIVG